MAILAKCTRPSLANPRAPFRMGPLLSTGVIPAGSPCYISAAGTATVSAAAVVGGVATLCAWDGFCIQGAAAAGTPVTLFGVGAEIDISSGVGAGTGILVPGEMFYIGAAGSGAGAIDRAASTTATDIPFAKAISTTAIRIIRPPL